MNHHRIYDRLSTGMKTALNKVLLGLIILGSGVCNAQDMVWTQFQLSHIVNKMKYYARVEDRITVFEQKTALIETGIMYGNKVKPIVSVWGLTNEGKPDELRLSTGFQWEYIRILAENRWFDNGTHRLRLRGRISFEPQLGKQLWLIFSNEAFFQRGWDHNRFCLTVRKKWGHFGLESGCMLYNGKSDQFNVLLINTSWNF